MSWANVKFATKEGGEWLKLEAGGNVIRIVSEPEDRGKHFINAEKKGYACLASECFWCAQGEPIKIGFLFHVIDRKDGKMKLAEFGSTIVEQLKNFKDDAEWAWDGAVMPYNVKIKKDGAGLDTVYSVIASPTRTELTAGEKAGVEKLKPLAEIKAALKKTGKPMPTKVVEEEGIPLDSIPF